MQAMLGEKCCIFVGLSRTGTANAHELRNTTLLHVTLAASCSIVIWMKS
jgi:hypothetical protein